MNNLNFITINTSEIYEKVISTLESGCSEELYPGDERRIFGEAIVPLVVALYSSINDACRQKMLRYARGEVLDALGDNRGVTREAAVAAKTVERFGVNTPICSNIIIPAGTRVTSDYVNYFQTTVTAVLPAGESYVDVELEATEGGQQANDIIAGAINVLVDMVPNIDTVTNTVKTHGGNDEEKDDAYRDRIRLSGSTLSVAGPPNAYRYWAMAADASVADAYVSSPTPGVVRIVPICYGGVMPSEDILTKVLASCSADDVRPLTDQVTVAAPTIQTYDIELVYYTTKADESACVETVEGDGGAIGKYIYWQGSSLNRDINPDYLRKLILAPDWGENLVGAVRVDIISPIYTDLDETTVAQFSGTLIVSHQLTTSE
ncbi:MAG: baseplate J/gp47 family protein [Lachnospiraceae bacterium]|nr:baseplate J/gp47 family protein [Lachnospiraceae bacterium]